MSHLRISPRHLGQLEVSDFCPRCFFYQVKMQFKLPFDRPMPGIMYHLDVFEKRIVLAHIDEHGTLPKWLKKLDCTSAAEFPPKMTMDFDEYDLTMVGMPDAVFKKGNNRLCLVDWKTAISKGEDDPFFPIYRAQLLGYTHLLEHNNIGTVDTAALVYFENDLKNFGSKPLDLLTASGFDVPFKVHIHEVEIDRSALEPLLKRMREFADMKQPPRGRSKCKNCPKLQDFLDWEFRVRTWEDYAAARDGLWRAISKELARDRQAAKEAWAQEEGDPDSALVLCAQDSIPAAWDF